VNDTNEPDLEPHVDPAMQAAEDAMRDALVALFQGVADEFNALAARVEALEKKDAP